MDNRFEQLRYKDKFSLNPEISMTQLATKMGISKATISKLEHDNNYDARISIIKKYKEQFPDVSYDYLLGATNTKKKQYNYIEEELPFSNDFYNSLKLFINDSHKSYQTEYMLEAFLNDPNALIELLCELFEALDEIYTIQHEEDYELYNFRSREHSINEQYFRITHIITQYLDNKIAPLLGHIFQKNLYWTLH